MGFRRRKQGPSFCKMPWPFFWTVKPRSTIVSEVKTAENTTQGIQSPNVQKPSNMGLDEQHEAVGTCNGQEDGSPCCMEVNVRVQILTNKQPIRAVSLLSMQYSCLQLLRLA
jgi:hypothetical protein